jgi:predicted transposase YdaD
MKRAYATDEIREMILAREKAHRDLASLRANALQEGHEQGRAEGREEGRRSGLQAGLDLALDLRFGEGGAYLKPWTQSATLQQLEAALAALPQATTPGELEALLKS